jgi:LacI family repressor for deo operon, udp, cdd, tsx, nupC, and nupG
VPYEERLVESAPGWGLASGQKAAARLLTRGVRFTAIFAQSDLLAIGAIKELRAHGIGVPEEVSVVGYDDIPVASFVDPPLTTVHQPMTEVGKRAVSLVLHAVGKDEAEPTVDLLPVRLVIRDSAVPPP